MLGRPCAVAGSVTRGDGLGRTLGFPTANLEVSGLALPPQGVYAAWAGGPDKERPAVVNVGFRPTLNQLAPALRVEAHLLDFEGDLYGQELELRWVAKLRDEQKFASLEQLKEQIGRDLTAARQRLAKY
jgi:riboflavin kinase/FMN adenylyltransferase